MLGIVAQSSSILLREGLESLLVIAALAAYLRKSDAHERLVPLYAGAGAAILASITAAVLLELFNNGAHNDMVEAVVILFAAALMLYVSGWLMLRQDPRAWQGFLKNKADAALAKQTHWAVASLAFLAVFREGAETVLFLHALAKTSGGWSMGLFLGLILAALVLAALFFVINIIAQKVPLRPLFIATSAFLFVMAIKFVGDAMQEFQEQQFVSFTPADGLNWLSSLGFNPTIEAVTVQVAVIALACLSFFLLSLRARKTA